MNRSRLLAWAMVLAVPAWAAAQPPPFAPPGGAGATLLPPNGAGAEVILVPQPYPVPATPPPPAAQALGEGWIFGGEIDVIRPHFRGHIVGGPLETTVSPHLVLGYQFPSTRAVVFEYRYFGASGDSTFQFAGDPAPVFIHRHTEGHVLDFDVRFRQGGSALFRSQWQAGLQAANISIFGFNPSPNFLSLVSNRFQGIGPHILWKPSLAVFDTGLEVFGLGDVGVMYGSNHGFSQVPSIPPTGPRVDWPDNSHNAFTLTLRWEVGVSYWFNWRTSRVSVAAGYGMDAYDFLRAGERFVSGGILLPASYQPGNVRLVNTGPFVRLEVRY